MIRTIRVLLVLAVVIGASAAGYWYFGQRESEASEEEFETVAVARGDMFETVSATGQVEPLEETRVGFDVAGQIAEITVSEGDRVSEGETLARLDDADLETRISQARQALEMKEAMLAKAQKAPTAEEIAAARAEIESAKATYDKVLDGPSEDDLIIARADLGRAEAALKKAQADYDRVSWLGGIEAMPQAVALEQATIDYERAAAGYRKAEEGPSESDVKAAEAQVARAEASLETLLDRPSEEDVEIARLDVDQARLTLTEAEADLADAIVEAPHAGVIASVDADGGAWVAAGAPMATIVDDSRLHVEVFVDEVDIGRIRVNQKVDVSLDSFPDEALTGSVNAIAPTPTNESGLISYKVTVGIEPGELPVRVGMTANADIVTSEKMGILMLPNRAIEVDRESGRYYAARLEAGVPVRTEIELGLRGETESQVVSGLEEGDQVAILTVSARDRLRQAFSGGGM